MKFTDYVATLPPTEGRAGRRLRVARIRDVHRVLRFCGVDPDLDEATWSRLMARASGYSRIDWYQVRHQGAQHVPELQPQPAQPADTDTDTDLEE